MKKLICLLISLVICFGCLAGCNLAEKDSAKDNARVVTTIKPITDTFVVELDKLNEYGEPVYVEKEFHDSEGNLIYSQLTNEVERTRTAYTYTSPKTTITKAELINYINDTNNKASERLQGYNYTDVNKAIARLVDEMLDEMVDNEFILIEANKLFYAGALYWTQADVLLVQQAIYQMIDNSILEYKNAILEDRGEEPISIEEEKSTGGSTTFPTPEVEPEKESPKYYSDDYRKQQYLNQTEEYIESVKAMGFKANGNFDWFDRWYTNADEWYINSQSYLSQYPGILSGDENSRSLAVQAFDAFLEKIFSAADGLVGLTKAQSRQINDDVKRLKEIRATEGVEYVYRELGSTLLMKLLVGDRYLDSYKTQKLQEFKTSNSVSVSESQVLEWYALKLKEQKMTFSTQSVYETAVKEGTDPILFTPSNRYIYVKHILLKFTDEDAAILNNYGKEIGYFNEDGSPKGNNEAEYLRFRQNLVNNMTVYPHLNGEKDLSSPMTVAAAVADINATMARFQNSPKYAEQALTSLLYKYNEDTGMFSNTKGYAVRYELLEGETEGYMQEFADGAREFRSGGYKIGQLLNHYVVTDYGVHVMYYADDTTAGAVKSVYDYVTPAEQTTIYEEIESIIYANKQNSSNYDAWKISYLREYKESYSSSKSKIIESTVEDIIKNARG